jgi:UDP-N-acetylmuramyl pentapeptide phosphotransferase/UDP-N-acetylglucosamine-1-phosphate transferase
MDLDKIILISFPFIVLINFILIKNYNFFFLKKTLDQDFSKPQAFHIKPTPRMGGFLFYIFFILYLIIFFEKNSFLNKIFFLGSFFFVLGFLGDLNVHIKPALRLFLMLIFSFFLIFFLDVKIFDLQIFFLNNLINDNKIISALFVCLCLMFVINGCNFIDGFNGLLIIHSIIILSILYFVNFQNINAVYLKYFILFFIVLCFSLLFYNFPKAKIFLGDGGAYFLGSVISLIVIETSNLNRSVSPFFFASILFYVFFEVFFSFFRKIIFYRSSPLKPDKKHLHMIVFDFIFAKNKNLFKSNYSTSIVINVFYFFLILPLLCYYKDKVFCEIYFLLLLIAYLLFYLFLSKKTFKKLDF